MDSNELKTVLDHHALYLLCHDSGQRADLRCTDLRRADLQHADLRGADLQGANLRGANLRGANLQHVDLRDANLQHVDLRDANLRDAILPNFQICPEKGAFTAFKSLHGGMIAELLIPESAKRTSSLIGRKCRASCAQVVSVTAPEGLPVVGGISHKAPDFFYTVGAMVYPDAYNDDPRIECTNGIHFFMTRREAEEY